MAHHISAVMLATLGGALLNEVKDADERAAVIERVALLLDYGERGELRAMAGLPPERKPK